MRQQNNLCCAPTKRGWTTQQPQLPKVLVMLLCGQLICVGLSTGVRTRKRILAAGMHARRCPPTAPHAKLWLVAAACCMYLAAQVCGVSYTNSLWRFTMHSIASCLHKAQGMSRPAPAL